MEDNNFKATVKYTLYGHPLSRTTCFVLIAAKFFGIEIEFKQVDLAKGEHKSEEFTKLNPLQTVPVLVVQEFDKLQENICDSVAIVTLLGARHILQGNFSINRVDTLKATELYRADEIFYALKDFHQRTNLHVKKEKGKDFQSYFRDYFVIVFGHIEKKLSALFKHDNNLAHVQETVPHVQKYQVIVKEVGKEESVVETRERKATKTQEKDNRWKFCFGDSPAYVDAFLFVNVLVAEREGMNLDDYPTIQRIIENLRQFEFGLNLPKTGSEQLSKLVKPFAEVEENYKKNLPKADVTKIIDGATNEWNKRNEVESSVGTNKGDIPGLKMHV